MLEGPADEYLVSFAQAGHPEADAEDSRVNSYNRGELVVSVRDLMRIFDIQPAPTKAPPLPTANIERFAGLQRFPPAVFNADGTPVPTANRRGFVAPVQPPAAQAAPEIQFADPNSCPTCAEKKKAAGG